MGNDIHDIRSFSRSENGYIPSKRIYSYRRKDEMKSDSDIYWQKKIFIRRKTMLRIDYRLGSTPRSLTPFIY